jgi:hypothetical protein
MLDPLDTCRFKLVRAQEHFHHLAEVTRDFAAGDGPVELDPDTSIPGEVILRVRLPKGPPDPYWATILGDAVQNTRAALDHLVVALVRQAGGKVTTTHKFPITSSAANFEHTKKAALKDVDPAAQDQIEFAQPWAYPGPQTNAPLRMIQTLSNQDKHHMVLPTVLEASRLRGQLAAMGDSIVEVLQERLDQPVSDGDVIWHARFSSEAEDRRAYLLLGTTHQLHFMDWRPSQVDASHRYVRDEVLPRFHRFFP